MRAVSAVEGVMVYRLVSLLTSFYFILDGLAGKLVHCVALANCSTALSVTGTLVYLAVFGCMGIPLAMGTVMWQSRWHADL